MPDSKAAKAGDWLQRIQAAWTAVPSPIRRVITAGVVMVVTFITAMFENWRPLQIWAATLGAGVFVAYAHAGYLLASAYAYRLRQGPPQLPPSGDKLLLTEYSGRSAVVEIRNEGQTGTFKVRGRILTAGKRVVQHTYHYSITPPTSGFQIKTGDMYAAPLALIESGFLSVLSYPVSSMESWPVDTHDEVTCRIELDVIHASDVMTSVKEAVYEITSDSRRQVLNIKNVSELSTTTVRQAP